MDRSRYRRDRRARVLSREETPGSYVCVVDLNRDIHILSDGPHLHPKVLGEGQAARFAGTLIISQLGVVSEVTNLSGAFRFESQSELREAGKLFEDMGFLIQEDALFWFLVRSGRK